MCQALLHDLQLQSYGFKYHPYAGDVQIPISGLVLSPELSDLSVLQTVTSLRECLLSHIIQ